MLQLGTISEGTLRPEDLIPALLEALEDQDAEEAGKIKAGYPQRLYNGEDIPDTLYELAGHMLEELYNALDEHCPPYCYVGAHEGNGSDIGVWPDIEAIERAVEDGEILKINAGEEWPEDAEEYEAILEVTDHGNITLIRQDGEELLSAV